MVCARAKRGRAGVDRACACAHTIAIERVGGARGLGAATGGRWHASLMRVVERSRMPAMRHDEMRGRGCSVLITLAAGAGAIYGVGDLACALPQGATRGHGACTRRPQVAARFENFERRCDCAPARVSNRVVA